MELETTKIYHEELDEYGKATYVFDGYFISYYVDGHMNENEYEIKSELISDSESRKIFSSYSSLSRKLNSYVQSNWKNGKMIHAKEHIEKSVSELELIVKAIRESNNEGKD